MSFPAYKSYRASGIEWLGELPAHWSCKPAKAVSTCNDDVLDEGTPADYELEYVEISGVESRRGIVETTSVLFGDAPSRARRRVKDGDVIVSTVRTYLRAIAPINDPPENLIVSTGFAVVRPRSVNSGFLGHLFGSEYVIAKVISRSVGVSYPAINASDLMSIDVPLPPLSEQAIIAAFLDRETAKIDALVEEQRNLIELLMEKRQAVVSRAVTKGLKPNVPMKDSGVEWLGEVPQHWEVKRLKHLASSKAGPFGSSLTKDQYVESGYRVYGQEQVIAGEFSIGDYYISEEKFAELAQYEVRPGDVLISCVGTFGKIAVVPDEAEPGVINPRLIRLRITWPLIPKYLEAVLRSRPVYEQFSLLSRGGTMDVINIEILSGILLVVPPIDEQYEILAWLAQEIGNIDALADQFERAVALLNERRAALISAAVTGKIDVCGLVEADASIPNVIAA